MAPDRHPLIKHDRTRVNAAESDVSASGPRTGNSRAKYDRREICRAPKLEAVMDKDLVDQLIDVAQRVVASGAISANGHGNVSLRVAGAQEMYFTAGPSLRGHPPAAVVRVGLDGTLLEGDLPPIQGAVVAMHTAMYADHPDVGCVLHTHSPYATAYAVSPKEVQSRRAQERHRCPSQ